MIDQRFYNNVGPFNLRELIETFDTPVNEIDSIKISDISNIEDSIPGTISFITGRKFARYLENCTATAVLMPPTFVSGANNRIIPLASTTPMRDFYKIADCFYPLEAQPINQPETNLVAQTQPIHPTAKIGQNVRIGRDVQIGANAEIGDNVIIEPSTLIHPGVVIGRDSHISGHCQLAYTLVGEGVRIHGGCQIGQSGFRFLPGTPPLKIRQFGRVIIQSGVEIGASCCIDRAGLGITSIGENCKLDNLIQVGHNVEIGINTIIAAHCALGGSARIGANVLIGGKVGIRNGIDIGDNVQIAGGSVLLTNVPKNGFWGGYPAQPIKEWQRSTVRTRREAKLKK